MKNFTAFFFEHNGIEEPLHLHTMQSITAVDHQHALYIAVDLAKIDGAGYFVGDVINVDCIIFRTMKGDRFISVWENHIK